MGPIYEPPVLPKRPKPVGETFLRGALYLALGIGSEAVSRPVNPWTYVPGTLILLFGLGIGMALLDRAFPRWATFVFVAIGVVSVILTFRQATSLFPVFLYLAAFHFTRWVLLLDVGGR